jgi:hypothetical protein
MSEISYEAFKSFADEFFHTVTIDKTGELIRYFFKSSHSLIIAPDGTSFDFQQHQQLHAMWQDEQHQLGPFHIVMINDDPPRARATGTVYWQATYNASSRTKGTIKAVAGEDWIIEKRRSQALKFIQYNTTFFQLLPDSAPITLNY